MKRCLLLLLALLPAAPARAVGPPPADDTHDLVVLHPKRPYRLRFHLRVGAQSFQAPWARQVGALFRYLDTDGDGRLSAKELGAAPGRQQWRQLAAGLGRVEPEAAPTLREVAGAARAATLAALRAYYGPSGAGPLRVTTGRRYLPNDALSTKLFALLDRDRDGKLTKAELLAAPRLMKALDKDEDEVVSGAELMGVRYFYQPLVFTAAGPAHGPLSGGLPFVSLRPGADAAPLVKALLGRYDRNHDKALSRQESGLDRVAFARLDGNGDGRLDADELAAWRSMPADLEVDVDLARIGPSAVARRGGLAAKHGPIGLTVRVEDWTLELRGLGSMNRRPSPVLAGRNAFDDLDRDGDGYLTTREVFTPPFRYVSWLRLADRDGDGKIARKEFEAFAKLQQSVMGVVTSLAVEDQGRSLFGWVDSDGDQHLGLRELRNAWSRLAGLGGSRAGFTAKDMPQGYIVSFWHGPLGTPEGEADLLQRRARPLVRGPVWFRKMDRNGDGDVSRSEWLGTKEDFDRIDADGDGLIGPDEADKEDRLYRKKR